MKQIFTAVFFVLSVLCAQAQETVYEIMDNNSLTLTEATQRAQQIFNRVGTGRGTGYKQFQRWAYERQFHINTAGYLIPPTQEWQAYENFRATQPSSATQAGSWTELGPVSWNRTTSWNPGVGRLSAMATVATNQNLLYVGSPGGGIWKSTNAATTWTPLSDDNSSLNYVFAITIHPTDNNTVFVGTQGAGLYKTTNGGASFALNTANSGNIRKILFSPTDVNTIFFASTNGIYKSVNGGTSFTQVSTTSTEDIEFKPNDPTVMYASGNSVMRSTNSGDSWTTLNATNGIDATGRTLVAVSAANANVVYAVQAAGSAFGRMYKSVDGGVTFSTLITGSPAAGTNFFGYESTGTGSGGQATYDMALDVNPTDANDVYIAGIICWRSTNGGNSFTALTEWFLPNSRGYNHADVHGLFWYGSTLYSISDGGLYKSVDFGDNWTDLSTGLGIRQFYRIAQTEANGNVITGGAQDNGSVTRRADGTWADWLGADGMEGLASNTDPLKIWGTSQNGSLYRSTNGGNTYANLTRPSAGNWVTPISIHPTNDNILYGGWTGVYKSLDGGVSWSNIAAGTISSLVTDIAVAPSNPNYIYASIGSTLYVTTNDGASWTTRSAVGSINDIWVDPLNPQKIYLAVNTANNLVMVSTDAGATFTSISHNLPAISPRSVRTDDATPRNIYVALNIGVYHLVEGQTSWTDFSTGLPKVPVNELEIHKGSGKIRVATYGRGVWESPLANGIPNGFSFGSPATITASCPVPNSLNTSLTTNAINSFANPITLAASNVPAGLNIVFGTNPVNPGQASAITINGTNTLIPGSYTFTVTGTATASANATRNITINIGAGSAPTLTAQPAPKTICANATTTFTTAATGATSYQWQVSTNGGGTFTNILASNTAYTGINTATLTIVAGNANATFNNNQYRALVTGPCGTVNTNAAGLTVAALPAISAQPTGSTVCSGASIGLTAAATGSTLSYQWQTASSCGGVFSNITGATNATYSLSNVTTNAVYQLRVTDACNQTVVTNCVAINSIAPPVFNTQPTNKDVCQGGTITFNAAATTTETPMYQWQVSTDNGSTFTNITNATTSSYSINNAGTTLNNTQYRLQVSSASCATAVNSLPARLLVRANPIPTLSASANSILPTQVSTLTANLSQSSGGTITTTWLVNNTPITNLTSPLNVRVDNLGTYQVTQTETFTSGTVCSGTSALQTIIATPSTKLFVYPIPNNGTFKVTYYADNASIGSKRRLLIYDSKGARVNNGSQQLVVAGPYTIFDVRLQSASKGIFMVILTDDAGNKIAQSKIFVK
jgi:hypothetical protein